MLFTQLGFIFFILVSSFFQMGCGDSTIGVTMRVDYSQIQSTIRDCGSNCTLRVMYSYADFKDANNKQVTIPQPSSAFPTKLTTGTAPNTTEYFEWGRAADSGFSLSASTVNLTVPLGKVGTEIMMEVIQLTGGVYRPIAYACYYDNSGTALSAGQLQTDLSGTTYTFGFGRTCGLCSSKAVCTGTVVNGVCTGGSPSPADCGANLAITALSDFKDLTPAFKVTSESSSIH